MKQYQFKVLHGLYKFFNIVLISLFAMSMLAKAEAPLDLATAPLSNSGPVQIKPNMLYVLDDSGSMGRSYMPDWATDATYLDDPSYNAVAYNPAVRYLPPVYFTSAGLKDTNTYPSQTGASTNTGANSNSKPNWRNVANNAYDTSDGYSNLEGSASYTVSIANEYCTRTDLRECVSSDIPTATHPYPAQIRWCNDATVASAAAVPADNACQSVRTGAFTNIRVPVVTTPSSGPAQATITFDTASSKPVVTRVVINGQDIMSRSTAKNNGDGHNNVNTIANRVRARINECTNGLSGQCDVSGYSASRSGNTVTIYAPGAVSGSPVAYFTSGSITGSATAFTTPAGVPANNRQTVNIIPSNNSYPYPGKTVKDSARADCAGATCTYVEEMTNYANWHAYYRTRMQMMKTSTSLAFEDVGDDFRMGFMTINTGASKALDFKDFTGANKAAWYTKLFSIDSSGGTPLRDALAKAGRIYADKYNLSGTFSDPMQYECQQNFTLLTTDGKWNGSAGLKLDGSAMTDQDNDPSEKGKYQGDNDKTSNELADVAKYYFDTDLRTSALGNCTGSLGSNVCNTSGSSPVLNQKQSMVTFTLGLGVDGTLAYDIDYGPDVPGDFKNIYDGTNEWPGATSNSEKTIDDLWHAAVNGDGRYFSAKKTSDLITQLREAIALIKVKTGAGAAAATSTLNPVSGDNFAYVASYTSGFWQGNLEKREIDLTDGSVKKAPLACVEDVVPDDNCASPSTIVADGVDANGDAKYLCVTTGVTDQANCSETLVGSECRVPITPTCFGELKTQSTRSIYFNSGGALADFTFSNLATGQDVNFGFTFLKTNLTQGSAFTTEQDANLTGDNLVNYIKGDKTYELNSPLVDNQLFRKRNAVLGDLIDSKPSFIGKPTFNYGDSGYQAFKTANVSRAGTVYVGSNDGMLHAFDSDTLEERWAFVPSVVIPHLWKLADDNYDANHSYYVNGDLTISDICVAADCSTATASDWKTILVAGLDSGGRGYYALDITNPLSPSLLWEIDPNTSGFENLGYSFGNPIVTKRSGDNKWVVVFSSGYNNIPDNNSFYDSAESTAFDPDPLNTNQYFNTGDGKGYLYVVEASSGNILNTLATGIGSLSAPSGLAKINAFVDDGEVNNLTTYVYGGDLNGYIWRFNIDSNENTLLNFARLTDTNNLPQPITVQPELGEVNNKKVVIVGTGKYLEVTDLDPLNYEPQSLYAIKDVANDTDPAPIYANARSSLIQQTVIADPDPAKSDERISGPANAVNFLTGNGWYLDFPDSGERQNVPSQLVLGTLLVPTTVPTSTACQPAGYGWFNFFNYETGTAVVPVAGAVSQRTSAPSVGFNIVYINGVPKVSNVLSDNPNPELVDNVPFAGSTSGFQLKRSIWREIIE